MTLVRGTNIVELPAPFVEVERVLPRRWLAAYVGAVLAIQAMVGTLLHNGVFQDEAIYLHAGRQYLAAWAGGPAVTEPYVTYFSGLPYLYPPLLALADQAGGLMGARLVSLILTLITTPLVFALTRRLAGEAAAMFAMAVFAVSAPVVFIGKLASYDAACLLLLTLAAYLAVRTAEATRWAIPLAILTGLVAALMCLVKYSGLMFVPGVLLLLTVRTVMVHGWAGIWRGCITAITILAVPVALIGTPIGADVWAGVDLHLRERSSSPVDRLEIFQRIVSVIGPIVAVAAIGAALQRWGIVLLVAGLLAPAYHLIQAEFVSAHKHAGYSLVFLAPLAGIALAWFWSKNDGGKFLAGALVAAGLAAGIVSSRSLYAEWPDPTAMATLLRQVVQPGDSVLSEEWEVPRYLLADRGVRWTGTDSYRYVRYGTVLDGADAYRAAIDDGVFDVVVIRFGPSLENVKVIDRATRDGGRYTLVDRVYAPTRFGQSWYWIFRKTA